jgi:hypothetical protein
MVRDVDRRVERARHGEEARRRRAVGELDRLDRQRGADRGNRPDSSCVRD